MICKLLLTVLLTCSLPACVLHGENTKAFLESISSTEIQCLDRFFSAFFLNDDFSYTLFGDKPMSFSGIDKPNTSSETDPLSIGYRQVLDVFRKYRSKFLNKNYIFVLNEDSNGTFVYFINKSAFTNTIKTNIDIFVKEFGHNFNIAKFLEEVMKEEKFFLEIIHHHEGVLGILLGYGRRNSMLFQRKADLLGRCWAYETQVKPNRAMTFDTVSIEKEIAYLDSKLGCFSEEHEYNGDLPVAPLGFAADIQHFETKRLKKKYQSTQKKINKIFSKRKPLIAILEILMDCNQ